MKTISVPVENRERLNQLAASYNMPPELLASVVLQHALNKLLPAPQQEIPKHEEQASFSI